METDSSSRPTRPGVSASVSRIAGTRAAQDANDSPQIRNTTATAALARSTRGSPRRAGGVRGRDNAMSPPSHRPATEPPAHHGGGSARQQVERFEFGQVLVRRGDPDRDGRTGPLQAEPGGGVPDLDLADQPSELGLGRPAARPAARRTPGPRSAACRAAPGTAARPRRRGGPQHDIHGRIEARSSLDRRGTPGCGCRPGPGKVPVMDVERLRADTPGTAHRIHLNNAGAALMSRRTLGAMTDQLRTGGRDRRVRGGRPGRGPIEATYAGWPGCSARGRDGDRAVRQLHPRLERRLLRRPARPGRPHPDRPGRVRQQRAGLPAGRRAHRRRAGRGAQRRARRRSTWPRWRSWPTSGRS